VFSTRVTSDLTPNRLSAAIARLRGNRVELDDLTESNPTRVGIDYPVRLLEALARPSGLAYAPEPFGMPSARDAVAGDFRRRGMRVPRDRVVLTSSTSEAYSILFKLLCDPGDEVLVPAPRPRSSSIWPRWTRCGRAPTTSSTTGRGRSTSTACGVRRPTVRAPSSW
jgi:hypothetical protein